MLVVALAVAVVLAGTAQHVTRTGGLRSPVVQLLAADLAVWAPLLLAIAWVVRGSGRARVLTRLGVRIGLVDLFAAVAIACICRAVDAFLSLGLFGTTGLVPQASLGGGPSVLLLLVGATGTAIVSPIVEELFFRGALQRGLAAALPRAARFLAVLVTAGLFALAHVLLQTWPDATASLEVFVTTLLLGLLVGTLVAVTGRIGGAMLAHVLFNGIAVALTWPV